MNATVRKYAYLALSHPLILIIVLGLLVGFVLPTLISAASNLAVIFSFVVLAAAAYWIYKFPGLYKQRLDSIFPTATKE